MIGSIQTMQFMEDGSILFPDIDNMDKDQKLTYELNDSILLIATGDITTPFGKIKTINDHFMVLNPVVEGSGEVIRGMNIIFYSEEPTELKLHPEVLKDLQAYSKWLVHAYGQKIDLTVGPGGKEYDHSSILQEGDQYFLQIDQKKFKIMTIYHDKMKVLGIGRDGYSEVQLIKD
ncbi:MAG: hypothetical protein HKN68_03940 [Saprospiraceae bacterium]|nr:hypothetical protein [Saprospiraceae bacterium]